MTWTTAFDGLHELELGWECCVSDCGLLRPLEWAFHVSSVWLYGIQRMHFVRNRMYDPCLINVQRDFYLPYHQSMQLLVDGDIYRFDDFIKDSCFKQISPNVPQ